MESIKVTAIFGGGLFFIRKNLNFLICKKKQCLRHIRERCIMFTDRKKKDIRKDENVLADENRRTVSLWDIYYILLQESVRKL